MPYVYSVGTAGRDRVIVNRAKIDSWWGSRSMGRARAEKSAKEKLGKDVLGESLELGLKGAEAKVSPYDAAL